MYIDRSPLYETKHDILPIYIHVGKDRRIEKVGESQLFWRRIGRRERRGGERRREGGRRGKRIAFCADGVAVRLACPSQRVRHNEESIVATETPCTYVRFPVIRYIRRDRFVSDFWDDNFVPRTRAPFPRRGGKENRQI